MKELILVEKIPLGQNAQAMLDAQKASAQKVNLDDMLGGAIIDPTKAAEQPAIRN